MPISQQHVEGLEAVEASTEALRDQYPRIATGLATYATTLATNHDQPQKLIELAREVNELVKVVSHDD
jgi:hypothetical protein